MAPATQIRDYSTTEEITHAISHGIAAVLAVVGLVLLVLKAAQSGGALEITAVALYAGCMVFMYVASTLYHGLFMTKARDFLKMLDHSAIYFKIAGTYTPFALITLPSSTGIWIVAGAWGAALLGASLKVRAFIRKTAKKFSAVSLGLYLAMGWAAAFMIGDLSDLLPGEALAWIIAGGLSFTIGAVFYALKQMPYSHAIWHLFVMVGSACHFLAIYCFVV